MASLDCEKAFNEEMGVLRQINDNTSKILQAVGSGSNNDKLIAGIEETNRLLTLLCVKLLGTSEG